MASGFGFGRGRDGFVHFKLVIVGEFFARLNVAQRVDEDAPVFFDRFAVRVAGMIDPARVVPANPRVDHYYAAIQTEEECVRVVGVVGHTFPGDAFSGVFDDARLFPDAFRGKNAAPMHAGSANFYRRWQSFPAALFL